MGPFFAKLFQNIYFPGYAWYPMIHLMKMNSLTQNEWRPNHFATDLICICKFAAD